MSAAIGLAAQALVRTSRLQFWARSYKGLEERPAVMTAPPTLSASLASTVNSRSGYQATHQWDHPSLQVLGTTLTALATDPTKRSTPGHITFADGVKQVSNAPISVYFATDAPEFELVIRGVGGTAVGGMINGKYISRNRQDYPAIINDGQPKYVKYSFGTDTLGYQITNATILAGGSGWTVGDVFSISGGTGTAATGVVTQVSAGAVVGASIQNPGDYSVLPTTTLATTGAGTGLTFHGRDAATATNRPIIGATRTARRMRRVRTIFHAPGQQFAGINIGAQDTLVPCPVSRRLPKICFIGDSITIGTYLLYAGAHMALAIAQMLGLDANFSVSAIGGTGWNKNNTAVSPNGPAWSDALRVADFISEAADIYIWMGSQNDTGNPALQAAVTATLNQVMAARPQSVHVVAGGIVASSTQWPYIRDGALAASDQRRLRTIDNSTLLSGTGSIGSETSTGNYSFYLSSDNSHIAQIGLDFYAEALAGQIGDALLSMIGD